MNNEEWSIGKILIVSVVAVVAIILFFSSFYIIRAGERGIVLTWGKPSEKASTAGLHLKVPIAQKIVKMDVQTLKYETDASAASKDLQIVHTKVAVNYHLLPENTPIIYQEVGLGYQEKLIQPAVQEMVKAATAQFTAEELITHRESVKEKIDDSLRTRLQNRGIIMETTSITNFDFSPEFNAAIEQKVTAEQQALTAKNKLAQIEYEALQVIAQANGTATATIMNAKANAESRLLNAQAEAEALRLQKEQINEDLIRLRSIEKWNGVLPVYSLGANTAQLIQLPTE